MPARFGALLRTLRMQTQGGLTQTQLAERLGVSQALLSAWESGAASPPRRRLGDLIAHLELDGAQAGKLNTAFEAASGARGREPSSIPSQTAPQNVAPPLGVEELHAQARVHVRQCRAENLSVWVLGATNLSVMRRPELLEGRWLENLLWGVDYTMLWLLDLIDDEGVFGAVLTTLAALERRAADLFPAWRAEAENLDPADRLGVLPDRPCAVRHLATDGLDAPPDGVRDEYAAFRADYLGESDKDSADRRGPVAPFITAQSGDEALQRAVKRVIRVWHPETGVVIYRPLTRAVPAAANVRLMPVTSTIVPHVSQAMSAWYWLAPEAANRIVSACAATEAALAANMDG